MSEETHRPYHTTLARYHEGKRNGEKFYRLLKNNIVEEKELFAKHGGERNKKRSGFAPVWLSEAVTTPSG